MRKKTVVFTGGGTAGHVFPGLAIIEQLEKSGDYNIVWIGSRGGMEEEIVKKYGIPYYGISSGKLRRYFSLKNFTDIFKIMSGFFQSGKYLKEIKPDLLFSKGGFVSVPPVVAAHSRKITAMTHESDIDPGLATKLNCRFVEKIFTGYELTLKFLKPKYRSKSFVSGNPVRQIFFEGDRKKGRDFLKLDKNQMKPVLLVLGGSSGALQVNNLIREALPELVKEFFIVHQMGEKLFIPSKTDGYYTAPFFGDEIADILALADIAVSRAGAGTLWELVATKTPSVLVPLSAGSRGDQIRNAEVFKDYGVAEVLEGEKANVENLLKTLRSMMPETGKYKKMYRATEKIAGNNSARLIAEEITKSIEEKESQSKYKKSPVQKSRREKS